VTEPREVRGLVPAEIAAVLVIALAPLPAALPAAVPLLVVASIARYVRRRSWAELVMPGRGAEHAAIGALTGAVALALAVVAGTPVVEALSHRAVEWSTFPIVRGSAVQLVTVALVVGLSAVAAELALRGWIVERVLELSPGGPVLPVLLGAIAEALITRGDFAARLGAGVFGLGLGWMYVASGRRIVAPVVARLTFQLGAVVLEALRVVG
jgi:hypothetical protein